MKRHDTPETEDLDEEYDVGYGKPPKHTRFKKGQSGNPKRGKNKPKSFLKHFEAAMDKPVFVSINGVPHEMSRIELAAENLANKAVKGEKEGVRLLADMSKGNLRDQRLETENKYLRDQLKKAHFEYEKLKEQKEGGVLVIPPQSVNELEQQICYGEDPEATLQRIRDNPEELKELVWGHYYRMHPEKVDE